MGRPAASGALFGVLKLLLLLAPAYAYAARVGNSAECNNCKLVAQAVQLECNKLEPTEDTADELVGSGRSRRRMRHGRSEIKIQETIERVCDELGNAGGMLIPDVMGACWKLLDRHGEDLGDVVYEHGAKFLSHYLCTTMAAVCTAEQTREQGMETEHERLNHFMDGEL